MASGRGDRERNHVRSRRGIQVLDALKEEYGNSLSMVDQDVGSQESVDEAVETVRKQTDCLDMLINCAGIAQNGSSETTVRCLNINTLGPIRMVDSFG